jgi:phosphoglycerate dehydrogenase-like enzyme
MTTNEVAVVPRIAVLDDYQDVARQYADWSAVDGRADVSVFHDTLADLDPLVARLAPFEIIATMRERTPFPRALVERLPRLRLLTTTGMQNRSFDLPALRQHGVWVSGTPSSYDTTSELTWCLILALARRILQEDRSMRTGGWQTTVGQGLRQKVLGLVGLGRIGATVAAVARQFGMTVIAWSPNLTPDRCAEAGVTHVDRAGLFASADFISIHMVLSDRTRGLVGAEDIARMKPSAYLVNTSRGPLVDEAALVAALEQHRIAGAGLDTFDQEPLPPGHRLRQLDNALLTPHLGYVADDTYKVFYRSTVENIVAFLDGAPIRPLHEAS